MSDKPKILTLNLRHMCLVPLCLALAAVYLGWPTVLIVSVTAFAFLLVISIRYRIGSVGVDSRTLARNYFQYAFLIKLADAHPYPDKADVRVFTFGLFLLANNGKMKAGFLKRHQLLAKA